MFVEESGGTPEMTRCYGVVSSTGTGPGGVVVDNWSAHQVAGVRQRIEAAGAELLYLPPYSPDYNPIEPCWGKIHLCLRAWKDRTLERLEEAIRETLATITSQNAAAWFQHCDYGIQEL